MVRWKCFQSPSLATMLLELDRGCISTSAYGWYTGVWSWGCPGGLGSASVRTRHAAGTAVWVMGTPAEQGTQRSHLATGSGDIALSSVQSLSRVWLFVTPWTAGCQASLSITDSQSPPKPLSIEWVMPSSHLILCCPFLLLPSIFPSIRVFSNESVLLIRWPKCWSFSFSISPSNEHPGLISFRMDWLDLLAVQGTLKSLLQHHSSEASILWRSAFFIVQLSYPYMTTGKNIALTIWTFVGKEASLLFSMMSKLVMIFLPRSKCLLISWLQSPSAVILEPPKMKSATVSTVSPSISHEVMGSDAMILVFWMLSLKPALLFHSLLSLFICHEVMGLDAMVVVFWMLSFKPTFSFSSVTFIKRLFSSSSLSAIRVVSSAYLRLLIFLPAVLIPACASSSPVFLMMYSAYKLNKQGDNIQCWHPPSPIWNQSVAPCSVLTIASWPAYTFLKRAGQVVWYSYLFQNVPQFIVIHTVKGFGIVNKSEIDFFFFLLELSCVFWWSSGHWQFDLWFLCLF